MKSILENSLLLLFLSCGSLALCNKKIKLDTSSFKEQIFIENQSFVYGLDIQYLRKKGRKSSKKGIAGLQSDFIMKLDEFQSDTININRIKSNPNGIFSLSICNKLIYFSLKNKRCRLYCKDTHKYLTIVEKQKLKEQFVTTYNYVTIDNSKIIYTYKVWKNKKGEEW